MMNSDLYSSVLSGHKLIVIVCDNGGFAVINRLQINQGGEPFNNQLEDTRHRELVCVDFAAHAAAMGCNSRDGARRSHELEAAFERARHSDRTYVIALQTDPNSWTEGGDVLGGRCARGQRSPAGARRAGRQWTADTSTEDWNMRATRGKVIVVSGGTQGLGEAIARQVVGRRCCRTGDCRADRRSWRGAGG